MVAEVLLRVRDPRHAAERGDRHGRGRAHPCPPGRRGVARRGRSRGHVRAVRHAAPHRGRAQAR
eukprot:12381749-Alexandrium_andersonii.AAC.1